MAYRVELTDRAANDLSDIYIEINAAESIAATRWFNGFEQAGRLCRIFPGAAPLLPKQNVIIGGFAICFMGTNRMSIAPFLKSI
jgi:hypothetical protein